MKKKFLFFSLLMSILVLVGCSNNSNQQDVLKSDRQSNTITWGVRGDVKLFGLIDVKDGEQKGFEADMAKHLTKHILGKKGKAKLVTVTSQSRTSLLNNGNVDAIIATLNITPDRQKVVDFTKPYFDSGQTLLVPKNSKIRNAKDLNGKTVICVVGGDSVKNVKKQAPKAKVLQLQDYAQALNALKSGQGDAMTADTGMIYGMAVQNKGYVARGGSFTHEVYGVAVKKGQTPLRDAIQKAMDEMVKDGEYNQLIKKWFQSVPGFNYKELYRY